MRYYDNLAVSPNTKQFYKQTKQWVMWRNSADDHLNIIQKNV